MKKHLEIIKKPIITEKSLRLARENNSYTFLVDRRASKGAIKEAIEQAFGVSVVVVKTSTTPAKKRRILRYNKQSQKGPRKRAVVKLAAGEKIAGFPGE